MGHQRERDHRTRTLGLRNTASVQHHLQMDDMINNVLIFMRDSYSHLCPNYTSKNTEPSGADVNTVHSSNHTVQSGIINKLDLYVVRRQWAVFACADATVLLGSCGGCQGVAMEF